MQSVHVKPHKHLEDKEKRRQLLLKARTTRIKKRAENLTQQRTIRKLSQQARRERERTVLKYAKEKQDKLSKQKEVEVRLLPLQEYLVMFSYFNHQIAENII